MSPPTDKIILTAGLVTVGSTVSASVLPQEYGGHGELPSPRLLVGTGLTFFGLAILGDIAPGVAGPLATAVAVTALTFYGVPVLDNYLTGTNRNPVGTPPPTN